MQDTIFIEDIKVQSWIGVYDWERANLQSLVLQLELGIPNKDACHTDDLRDTVNYAEVVACVRSSLRTQHFLLLEALAEHIAALILAEFATPWVRVSLAKVGILSQVGRVGVRIERHHQSPSVL